MSTIVGLIKRFYALLVISIALTAGCEENQLGLLDIKGNPPFISTADVAPDTTNIDTLTPVGGTYTISATVHAKAIDVDGQGDLQSVIVQAFRPASGSAFFEQPLRDDGVAPDQTAGDTVYSGTLQFSLTRAQAGRYRIHVVAQDSKNFLSNTFIASFIAARNNSVPRLSSLSAPDTVTLPPGGSLIVGLAITAADSDGLADVREVFFQSLTSTNPDFKFLMKDDGSLEPPSAPFFLRSGDAIPGDGIYAVNIPLADGPNVRRTNVFSFKAVDSFGAVSDSLIHLLTVR